MVVLDLLYTPHLRRSFTFDGVMLTHFFPLSMSLSADLVIVPSFYIRRKREKASSNWTFRCFRLAHKRVQFLSPMMQLYLVDNASIMFGYVISWGFHAAVANLYSGTVRDWTSATNMCGNSCYVTI